MAERDDRGQQRPRPGLTETEPGCFEAVMNRRHDHLLEGGRVRRRGALLPDRFEEPGVRGAPDRSEPIEVGCVHRLLHTEIGGIVDRRLHPDTVEILEVRLGLGRPVVDLDMGIDAGGDDLGAEGPRGARRHPPVEHQRHLLGVTDIEMVADRGVEPRSPVTGTVEDRGVGELDLTERELPPVTQLAVERLERAAATATTSGS